MLKTPTLLGIALVALMGSSHASEVNSGRLVVQASECAQIIDNLTRLTCYDKLFKNSNASTSTKQETHRLPQDSLPASTAAPTAPPSTSNKPAKKNTETTINTTELFGLEQKVETLTADYIESTIIGSFSNWKKGMIVELENGQKWEIRNSRDLYFKVDNPEVKIEKGALGSFFMGFKDLNRRLRVKRVE